MVALFDIEAGSEFTFDYGFRYDPLIDANDATKLEY